MPSASTSDPSTPSRLTRLGHRDPETLALAALDWLVSSARGAEPDPTLYSGDAGIVLTLVEAHRHFDDDRWADAAVRGARGLAAALDGWDHRSLYFGTTGMAVALHAVALLPGRLRRRTAARRALTGSEPPLTASAGGRSSS